MGAAALVLLGVLGGGHAYAQQPTEVGPLYAFSVVASERVDNDWLTATLAVQVDGEDPAALAQRINRTMQAALDIVEPMSTLRVQTRDYRIVPELDEKRRRTERWRGSQVLELQSDDVAAAMAAIQQLQATLQMQGMGFSVAPRTLSEASDRLIEQALRQFEARATLIARTAGATAHRVVDAEVSTQEARGPMGQPRMAMRAEAQGDAMDAGPALSGGSSLVTVNVYGHIELLE